MTSQTGSCQAGKKQIARSNLLSSRKMPCQPSQPRQFVNVSLSGLHHQHRPADHNPEKNHPRRQPCEKQTNNRENRQNSEQQSHQQPENHGHDSKQNGLPRVKAYELAGPQRRNAEKHYRRDQSYVGERPQQRIASIDGDLLVFVVPHRAATTRTIHAYLGHFGCAMRADHSGLSIIPGFASASKSPKAFPWI